MSAGNLVQLPFRAGIDEASDPKQTPVGKLRLLENGVWNKIGRVEKRFGVRALGFATTAGGFTGGIKRLWSRGGELAMTDGARAYSFIEAKQQWRSADLMPGLEATWKTGIESLGSASQPDVDASDDYIALVWRGYGGSSTDGHIFLRLIDRATGSVVVSEFEVSAGASTQVHPRVLIMATQIVVVYRVTVNDNIVARCFDLATLTWSAAVVLCNDAHSTTFCYDVAKNGADFTLVYQTNANALTIYSFDETGAVTVVPPANIAATSNIACVSLHATVGENLYVVYGVTGTFTVRYAVLDPASLAITNAATTIYTGTGVTRFVGVVRYDASNAIVCYTEQVSTTQEETSTHKVSSAGVIDGPSQRRTRWARLCSKPFVLNDRFYMTLTSVRPALAIADIRAFQNTSYVVEIETSTNVINGIGVPHLPHRMVACIRPRNGGHEPISVVAGAHPTPPLVPIVDGQALVPTLYVTNAPDESSRQRCGVSLATLAAPSRDPWRAARVGDALAIACGAPSVWDGRCVNDIGFLHPPRVVSATPGGGGNQAAGNYAWCFVYEYIDANGMLHRSLPSQPTLVTLTAGQSVAFVLENATTSSRTDTETGTSSLQALPVRIVPYRTVANGSTFYRMTLEPNVNVVTNDPTVATTAWTDTRSDSALDGGSTALSSRPYLYTTGGVLDEACPPSFTTIKLHRSRLFGVAGDLRNVWFSKTFSEDPGVFPGFHEDLRFVLDDEIIGIESLDDKLVIFTRDGIFIVTGDGPAANGDGTDHSQPVLVQSDLGCIDAKSIVATPDGVMFQTMRGLYLLTRALELVWLGRSVQDTLAAFPNVKSAELVGHRSQVRFTCVDNDGTSGRTLVYDYVNREWSVFRFHDDYNPDAVFDTTVYHGGVWYAGGGNVVADDETTHLDAGEWVTLAAELAWLSPGGALAWHRVQTVSLLGTSKTPHDIIMKVARDYEATYMQTATFLAGSAVAAVGPLEKVRIRLKHQKLEAVLVRIEDRTPTDPGTYPVGTGQGAFLEGLGFIVAPKSGPARASASRRG